MQKIGQLRDCRIFCSLCVCECYLTSTKTFKFQCVSGNNCWLIIKSSLDSFKVLLAGPVAAPRVGSPEGERELEAVPGLDRGVDALTAQDGRRRAERPDAGKNGRSV